MPVLPGSSYPVLGIGYFLARPSLWVHAICGMLIGLVCAVGLLVASFALLPPQVAGLVNAGCPAGVAYPVVVIFCLLEGVIVYLILFAILMPLYLDGLFDKVLKLRGLGHLFERDGHEGACRRGCGIDCGIMGLSIVLQVVLLIVTSPLHAIPILGSIAYFYCNGFVYAWQNHIHFHTDFLHMNFAQSKAHVRQHAHEYASFGAVAMALAFIPVLNFLTIYTNIVGAALWAADELYAREGRQVASTSRQSVGSDHALSVHPE